MTEPRQLLAFGSPVIGPIPTMSPGFAPPPRSPSPRRQGERITPQFTALADALTAQRMGMVDETPEQDPELVAVFDLAGSVDGFMRAVRDIEGLEFLAELIDEPVEADEDFYYVDMQGEPTEQQLQETLYVVMSNAQAVTELVRLFGLWQADHTVTFPRGYAPLKQVFVLLRAVRRWGPEDRVRETGLLDQWREDVEVIGQQGSARVEIELWYRLSDSRRAAVQSEVEQVITHAGGRVIRSALLPAIEYHALLADIPYAQVARVLDQGVGAIELLTTEAVMLVAAARPMTVPGLDPASVSVAEADLGSAPTDPPRVALLDGLPLSNHEALVGRLVVDDPDKIESRYTVRAQQHGTGMASLICHGDLAAAGPALATQLYVRPIMQPHDYWKDAEQVPPDELLVDLVHRCFVRLFDGDGTQPPASPGVRVVNLSIGDPAKVFVRRLSPLAKLLDWLSHRYNVLVIVSAGNHRVETAVGAESLDDQDALHQEVVTFRYMHARQLGLLSPAEAINVLTVGATHSDSASPEPSDTVVDAIPPDMPASYGAVGFGHRRSVKPEVLLPGGRLLFQRPVAGGDGEGTVQLVEAQHSAVGPGLLVAAPAANGSSSGTAFTCGTSNSAALASRTADQVLGLLARSAPVDEFPFPGGQYHPVLTKTLLVHAAEWGDSGSAMHEMLDLEARRWRREVTQLIGYGRLQPDRVATAARHRVVLLGAGSITDKQRHTFSLPLPPGLATTTEWRRLTITLGWFSPINPRTRIHRQARLRFSPPEGHLGGERTEADANAARMGTLQHEIFEGRRALAFASGDAVQVNVDCRIDAGRVTTPIRYGLAVSIEMATTVRADIHAELRQALRAEVRTRAQVAPR
jgi:hypothetical protein